MPRKLAAGNWKMNGLAENLEVFETLALRHGESSVGVLICPPATLIAACRHMTLEVGGQDCHHNTSGAHTGDISAQMLHDAGATYVITGHSERRADHGETNSDIAAKSQAAYGAGLQAIICIGETLEQRESGTTLDVIDGQLA